MFVHIKQVSITTIYYLNKQTSCLSIKQVLA